MWKVLMIMILGLGYVNITSYNYKIQGFILICLAMLGWISGNVRYKKIKKLEG
jgi:hypothetical protein